MNIEFSAVEPWPLPRREDCLFYHSMTYPGGDSVDGAWDIRGLFGQYIGNFPISGKTVLDVGTAGGFIAFEAEQAGAVVTALDASHASQFDRLHFGNSTYHLDRAAAVLEGEAWLSRLKAGFWYSWNRYGSAVDVLYAPLTHLPYLEQKFDVVIAGAILEHLADPVSTIGNLARLAREAVIIAFTPVADAEALFMETANGWSDPNYTYTFWTLSCGLYERIFSNLGFTLEIIPARARYEGREYVRSTLVARRITEAATGQSPTARTRGEGPGGSSQVRSDHLYIPPTEMSHRLKASVAERDAALATCRRLEVERDNALAEVAAMHRSTSWALTYPMRALAGSIRSFLTPSSSPTLIVSRLADVDVGQGLMTQPRGTGRVAGD